MIHMNEMDYKFSKIVIFSNQYKILRKSENAFDGLDVYLRHGLAHKLILECVEVEKGHLSSLQNLLYCQAELPLKTDISVEKFNECLID